MANEWLRLWHDMPTDPKFRTIARISKQPISLVLAVYLHLLVDGSRNVTRGLVTVTREDLASALDVTEDEVSAILGAMEGRLIEARLITGWARRQPKREDPGNPASGSLSAAERKRNQRDREKQSREVTPSHDASRLVTTDKDKDKDKDQKLLPDCAPPKDLFASFWELYPKKVGKKEATKAFAKLKANQTLFHQIASALATQAASQEWIKDGGAFIPHAATWLNGERWKDEPTRNAPLHPSLNRHHDFGKNNYNDGLQRREDGSFGF